MPLRLSEDNLPDASPAVERPPVANRATVSAPPSVAGKKAVHWLPGAFTAPDTDVVLCSRARLARNLRDLVFPGQASERDLRRAAQEVRRAALADTEILADLNAVALTSLGERERAELVDTRRISPELAEGKPHRYALLDDDGVLSLFVNEEDHVRIQALAPGNDLRSALSAAQDADTRLKRRLTYAESAEWGYLTTALTNLGTGLRLSALTHLPALTFLKRVNETLTAFHNLDFSVRGAHGEHSRAAGDLYQVSNTTTLGLSPEHIAGRLRPVVDYLVAAERAARQEIAETASAAVAELARTAWSRIVKADRLDAVSALDLLSALRLAAAIGVNPFGKAEAAPDPLLFASLVWNLHTGRVLTDATVKPAGAVRDALHRPAKIRTALRGYY
ncbi:MAG: protein arginine kinase [Armatimonadaceae bacterium]